MCYGFCKKYWDLLVIVGCTLNKEICFLPMKKKTQKITCFPCFPMKIVLAETQSDVTGKKLEKEAKNKYNYFMGCQLKSKKPSFALIFWVICLLIWLINRKIQSRIDYDTFMNEKRYAINIFFCK